MLGDECNVARYARRSVRGALIALGFGLAACTPIGEVNRDRDAGSSADAVATECEQDKDCLLSTPCSAVQCREHVCVPIYEDEGTVLADDQQRRGDCKKYVCDVGGQTREVDDDTDVPMSDGNPCRSVKCEQGEPKYENLPDSTPCNENGTCTGGSCSRCDAGGECSRSDDCTVHRYTCSGGTRSCDDTGIPRSGVCGRGKVCSDGSCVPCVVGAACKTDDPCLEGRIASCEEGIECEQRPLTGPTCGTDGTGRTLYCMAGSCTHSCREGSCSSSTDPCLEGRWDCTTGGEPSCMMLPRDDGASCGEGKFCRAGACVRSALVNGDFGAGLEGWTTTGDAARFRVAPDADQRPTLSTSTDGHSSGGALAGTLSQTFTVPDDALALRFTVSGGHAHVRLKDINGNVLHDCVGRDSDQRIAVSWELGGLRGQRMVLAIEDDITTGDWAFVTTTGFDVVRQVDMPLRNPLFLQGLDGWETTGDGLHFNVFDTYNYFGGTLASPEPLEMYGRRRCVSTYTRDPTAGTMGAISQGTASQTFIVPSDAVALRFAVHGGSSCSIQLQHQSQTLYSVSAMDSDARVVLTNWDLKPHRGKAVRLIIRDASTLYPYGYIGTTGFDLITSYNGP